MIPKYEDCVLPYVSIAPQVVLTKERETQITKFLAKGASDYMRSKGLTHLDNAMSWTRKKDLICGEAALEQYLDVNLVTYKLTPTFDYNSEGVFDGEVRIKVFKAGSFPVFYRPTREPFIFVMQEDTRTYRICGVANRMQINSFSSQQLVPEGEYNRDRKAGFYGFYELQRFVDLYTLYTAFKR